MNQPKKTESSVVRFITKSALLLTAIFLLTGCSNMQVKIKQPILFTGHQTQLGSLSLKVSDERVAGPIGVLRGGFGNKVRDIVLADDLNTAFTSMFTQALQSKGYSVVADTNAQLDVKITMFVTDTTGYGKFARHKALMQLRDGQGDIRWEKNLLGEAAGAHGWRLDVTASMEDCMNLALERFMRQAAEEFSSEFFRQQVRKLNQKQQ